MLKAQYMTHMHLQAQAHQRPNNKEHAKKRSNWASFKMAQTHMGFSYSSHGPKKM